MMNAISGLSIRALQGRHLLTQGFTLGFIKIYPRASPWDK